jgi:hypothetical protein
MYVCMHDENKMQRVYCVIHLFNCLIHVRQIGRGENFIF